jgi:hypothetical protein
MSRDEKEEMDEKLLLAPPANDILAYPKRIRMAHSEKPLTVRTYSQYT